MNQIANTRLFIGDQWSAVNQNLLKQNNIKFVLNASTVVVPTHDNLVYKQLFWEDTEQQEIKDGLKIGIEFIENTEENVLIFCQAGRSRSGTMLIGYLMKKLSTNYEETLEFVRKYRNIIEPNPGFAKQLKSMV